MDDNARLKTLVEQAQKEWRERDGKMSSKRLEDLTREVHGLALAHQAACHEAGIDLLIYCTLRSNEEQDELYAIGRSKPGKIVTNARAGQSAHNPDSGGKSSAYDCVPLRYGKPVWGSSSKEDAALWAKVGSLAEEVGLSWSGRWTGKMKEMAHMQSKTWVKRGKP